MLGRAEIVEQPKRICRGAGRWELVERRLQRLDRRVRFAEVTTGPRQAVELLAEGAVAGCQREHLAVRIKSGVVVANTGERLRAYFEQTHLQRASLCTLESVRRRVGGLLRAARGELAFGDLEPDRRRDLRMRGRIVAERLHRRLVLVDGVEREAPHEAISRRVGPAGEGGEGVSAASVERSRKRGFEAGFRGGAEERAPGVDRGGVVRLDEQQARAAIGGSLLGREVVGSGDGRIEWRARGRRAVYRRERARRRGVRARLASARRLGSRRRRRL